MSNSTPVTNQSFYDRISHAYDLISDAGEHKARETGEQALDVQPGECVLEIGYGTGNTMIHLATAVGDSGSVSGIDVSTGMLEVATKKLTSKGFAERIDLSVGDARKLPYEDNTFDAVFASFTLELFPLEDIPVVLAEVARVLKPGGRLGVVSMATVQEGDNPSGLEKTYVWMHEHFPHIVDCQPIDVVRLVENAGLKMQQKVELAIWTMPVRCVVATVS
jgi:demethylmenaquinone methyltransferase/2-methoxy-6-polyprenyl-1,4-benzoquinol methylase